MAQWMIWMAIVSLAPVVSTVVAGALMSWGLGIVRQN